MPEQTSSDLKCSISETFRKFSAGIANFVGGCWAFVAAIVIILGWALSGPLFGFSDTWQLVINTGTTIITFLMVFLIQNTQNRDARAIHLKLDELIRSTKRARNALIDVENLTDEELAELQKEFEQIRARARVRSQDGSGSGKEQTETEPEGFSLALLKAKAKPEAS